MDEETYLALKTIGLYHSEVIYIKEIEDRYRVLKEAKENRSHRAYCWTCSSWSIKYVMEKYNTDICTYIDADEFFYTDPESLIKDFNDSKCDVGIIGHNFGAPWYEKRMSANAGKYCVQFNSFRHTLEGKRILEEWCTDCAALCLEKSDGNSFGDQKYIEKWEQKYGNIYVYKQIGAGVAPWNMYRFRKSRKTLDGGVYLYDRVTKRDIKVYFIHFHSLVLDEDRADINVFCRYGMHDKEIILDFYKEYIDELMKTKIRVAEKGIIEKNDCMKNEIYIPKKKVSLLKKIQTKGIYLLVVEALKYRLLKGMDYIYLYDYA